MAALIAVVDVEGCGVVPALIAFAFVVGGDDAPARCTVVWEAAEFAE
jgi:hypothetical protein